MKSDCDLIQERLVDYCDGMIEEADKLAIEAHLAVCPNCTEEVNLWLDSTKLIRDMQLDEEEPDDIVTAAEVNQNVMNRIYAEQSWFMPAVRRTYSFSHGFRMKVAGLLAVLFTVFTGGFLYSVYDRMYGSNGPVTGVMETADAVGAGSLSNSVFIDVPVASLSDPFVLRVSPVMPEYWIALALLGVMMTLLIMNWFSRVRA